MKPLKDYILENDKYLEIYLRNNPQEFDSTNAEDEVPQNLPGGVDVALVGEIKVYSESSELLSKRKKAVSDWYKKNNRRDFEYNAEYLAKTPVMKLYIDTLIKYYKENVDEHVKLNPSSYDELGRQLSNDIILQIHDTPIR